jgi:hypothetical protein
MTIPMKYEDAVAKLEAAKEEINCLKSVLNGMEFQNVDAMVLDGADACLFLGQDSARIIKGIQSERNELWEELDNLNDRHSLSVSTRDGMRDEIRNLNTENSALQNRLTVAEQRESLLNRLLSDASGYTRHPDYDWDTGFFIEVEAALNTAEGEGS